MFIRACCLLSLFLFLSTGCQTPIAGLFPWTDDSSVPSLTEAELNGDRDDPKLSEEAFADTVQLASAEPDTLGGSGSDNLRQPRSSRVDAWLLRGQDAIRQAGANAQPAAMLSEATHSFREVLRIDPDNAEAFHGLAIVSDLNQDWESADYSYKRALAIRPNDVNLLNDQGYSYLLQNRYHEASQYLNRALQISPGHEMAHINMAILHIRRGNQDRALASLGQIYPAAKARQSMASLMQQHQPSAPAFDDGAPMVPMQNSGTFVAGLEQQRNPMPSGNPADRNLQQPGRMPAGHLQQSPTQLFNPIGVIETRRPQSPFQPVSAAGRQVHPNRVSPATLHQSAEAATAQSEFAGRSPLDSARSVGGTFQMPRGQQNMRPRLPATANVYNPDYSASKGLIQQTSPGRRSARMSEPNGGPETLFGAPTTQTQPPQYQHQSPQPYLGQQIPGRPNYGGTEAVNNFQRSDRLQAPVYPASNSAYSGAPVSQTGPFYGNPTAVAGNHGQNFPQQPGVQHQFSAPQMTNQFQGSPAWPQPSVPQIPGNSGYQNPAITNTAARPQTFPVEQAQALMNGQIAAGSYGMQPPNTPGSEPVPPVPLAPQYFSPPPVMGDGYRDQREVLPDPLSEYRATRQQLQNEYNQTLQTLGESQGGRAFQ